MKKLAAVFLSFVLASVPAVAFDLSRVSFVDDFLGINFDSRWNFLPGGTGKRSLEPLVGGWARLWTLNATGNSRMRLGEELGNSAYNVPHWCVCRNAVAEAIVFINTVPNAMVSIGFMGINDPQNIGGALHYNPAVSPVWWLQTIVDGQITNVSTNWTHTNGRTFRVRIETSPAEVRAYINGNLVATSTTTIPQNGLVFELQIWNLNGFAAGMWVDAVAIEQDR